MFTVRSRPAALPAPDPFASVFGVTRGTAAVPAFARDAQELWLRERVDGLRVLGPDPEFNAPAWRAVLAVPYVLPLPAVDGWDRRKLARVAMLSLAVIDGELSACASYRNVRNDYHAYLPGAGTLDAAIGALNGELAQGRRSARSRRAPEPVTRARVLAAVRGLIDR